MFSGGVTHHQDNRTFLTDRVQEDLRYRSSHRRCDCRPVISHREEQTQDEELLWIAETPIVMMMPIGPDMAALWVF
jgi:hypothetical protein